MIRVSDELALQMGCPQCGAEPGDPCVYVWPKGVAADAAWRTRAQQERVDRVGKPTERAHNCRREVAAGIAQRQARLALRRARRETVPPVVPASLAARSAARAEQEFDRREYLALRAWLAEHASLFTGKKEHP